MCHAENMPELESEKNDLQKQLRETQENLDKNEESLFEMRQDLTAGQTDLADSRQTIDALRDQLDTLKDRPQRVRKPTYNAIHHTKSLNIFLAFFQYLFSVEHNHCNVSCMVLINHSDSLFCGP